jgi:hypothetical protein
MADPQAVTPVMNPIPPPISPTGQAILPAKRVPLAMAIATLPGAVAGVLQLSHLWPQAAVDLGVASGVLWAILGVVSPGLRRASP